MQSAAEINDTPQERQVHARSAVYVEAKLIFHRKTTDVVILNVSMTGAKLRADCAVKAGDIIQIYFNENMRLEAEVVWQSRSDFGVCFIGDPVIIQDIVTHIILEEAPARESRQFARRSVFFSGMLRSDRGSCHCRIRNVSVTGAMVTIAQPMLVPDKAKISISRFGTFRVNAIWQSGTDVGFRFLHPHETIAKRFGELFLNNHLTEPFGPPNFT